MCFVLTFKRKIKFIVVLTLTLLRESYIDNRTGEEGLSLHAAFYYIMLCEKLSKGILLKKGFIKKEGKITIIFHIMKLK